MTTIQDDRKPVAIKVIQRSRLGKPADKLLAKEVEILKSLKARGSGDPTRLGPSRQQLGHLSQFKTILSSVKKVP